MARRNPYIDVAGMWLYIDDAMAEAWSKHSAARRDSKGRFCGTKTVGQWGQGARCILPGPDTWHSKVGGVRDGNKIRIVPIEYAEMPYSEVRKYWKHGAVAIGGGFAKGMGPRKNPQLRESDLKVLVLYVDGEATATEARKAEALIETHPEAAEFVNLWFSAKAELRQNRKAFYNPRRRRR